MFHPIRIATVGFCLLSLIACNSQPDVQLQDNTLTTSLPERVREVARLGTVPLEVLVKVNDTLVRQIPVSNDVSENLVFDVDVPADQANTITIEWMAAPGGTRVLLADNTIRTQPNQETVVISNYNDTGERFDFDGDGRFNIDEARENRNILGLYDLEVPRQTNFLAARNVLTPGSGDGDTSFTRVNGDTTREETNTDRDTTFSLRHDGTNLVLYVCGQDEDLQGDDTISPEGRYWHDDTVFLYLDGADSDNNGSYDGLDDFQFAFVRSTQEMIVSKGSTNPFCTNGDCVFHDFNDPSSNTQCVYELNVSIPFEDLNITVGEAVGFDLEITDDDDGDLREGSSGFIGFIDDSSTDPSTFGKIILR